MDSNGDVSYGGAVARIGCASWGRVVRYEATLVSPRPGEQCAEQAAVSERIVVRHR